MAVAVVVAVAVVGKSYCALATDSSSKLQRSVFSKNSVVAADDASVSCASLRDLDRTFEHVRPKPYLRLIPSE